MDVKSNLLGAYFRMRALPYLYREWMGLPRTPRSQEITFAGFEKYFSREVDKLKTKKERLARMDGRFARVTTLDIEVEVIRTHLAGIEQLLGGRQANGELLEVGAGFGRTLIPLSLLMPNAKYSGLEYTREGPKTAQRYLHEAKGEIDYVVSRLGTRSDKSPVWQSFQTGDGKAMPFADKSFDVAYTNLVLEQIPYPTDHLAVLREIRRVVRRGACFLEPWRDAQSPLGRAYLYQNGYFNEPSSILKEVGFSRVEYRSLDFQHNLNFRLGYAIAIV